MRLPATSWSDSWVLEMRITKNLFLGTIPERRHDADSLRFYVMVLVRLLRVGKAGLVLVSEKQYSVLPKKFY